MIKAYFSTLLRRFHLIYFTDHVRFIWQRWKNMRINHEFRKTHPAVKLPPDYLIYESFQLDYQKYYEGGYQTAQWLVDQLSPYVDLQNAQILDWGCGPGRIIRHLPDLCGANASFFGTDYNEASIQWCQNNLPGIAFNHNHLTASLPYSAESMDLIYGISVFTHLSQEMHHLWYRELLRILAPGGILFFTTHGHNFRIKLTENEREHFDKGQLIVRGHVKEGHRTFTAFQPVHFMNEMFSGMEILQHQCPPVEKGKYLPQDIWIIRKPAK